MSIAIVRRSVGNSGGCWIWSFGPLALVLDVGGRFHKVTKIHESTNASRFFKSLALRACSQDPVEGYGWATFPSVVLPPNLRDLCPAAAVPNSGDASDAQRKKQEEFKKDSEPGNTVHEPAVETAVVTILDDEEDELPLTMLFPPRTDEDEDVPEVPLSQQSRHTVDSMQAELESEFERIEKSEKGKADNVAANSSLQETLETPSSGPRPTSDSSLNSMLANSTPAALGKGFNETDEADQVLEPKAPSSPVPHVDASATKTPSANGGPKLNTPVPESLAAASAPKFVQAKVTVPADSPKGNGISGCNFLPPEVPDSFRVRDPAERNTGAKVVNSMAESFLFEQDCFDTLLEEEGEDGSRAASTNLYFPRKIFEIT